MTTHWVRDYGAIVTSAATFFLCASYQRVLLRHSDALIPSEKKEKGGATSSFFREFMQVARIALPTVWCKEALGTFVFVLLFFVLAVIRALTSEANGRVLKSMTEGTGGTRLRNFTHTLLLRTALHLLSSVCSSCVEHLRTWLIGCYRVRLSKHFQERYYSQLVFYRAAVIDKRLEAVDSVVTTYCAEFAEHFTELPYYFVLPALGSATSMVALIRRVGAGASAAACGLVLASVLLMKKFSPPFGKIYASLLSKEDAYRRMLSNSLSNVENIALHRGGEHTRKKLDTQLGVLKGYLDHFALSRGHFNLLELSFATTLRNIASIIVFGDALRKENKSTSDIYVELLYLRDLSKSVTDVVSNFREISHLSTYTLKLAEFDRILKDIEGDTCDTFPCVASIPDVGTVVPTVVSPSVPIAGALSFPLFTFTNVKLKTPTGHVLFENLNLTIQNDQDWVITGNNGSGKTSLLRLISGLWRACEGDITMSSCVKLLFAPQESYVVPHCTLVEQILYPKIITSLNEGDIACIKEAISLAGAESVVEVLGGFESPAVGCDLSNVDETYDWSSLSGGQKQRVNMARVFYQVLQADRSREIPVVLLDEATSMMDDTEEKVMLNLRKLNARMISVTHREQVVKHHTHVLRALPGGRWMTTKVTQYISSDDVVTQGISSVGGSSNAEGVGVDLHRGF
ncbi:ABC transporter, putative [Trypanosoma brucei gambiense DAL972]|uniref:ABC transporter, putative n=1 Tax=Trypanosoma brucei gambiense (strain MHOM/CI/86/DAL972) TaxID=679716 RepID=D0A5P9_TRYB9|nr:ABC transporter, putative [Trypanosoma brucei gambiense DAL972]CBH17000.1 ABC transporter, putative [Trypanosoma brucei gambiense DAL972]|eukprot:XP_011779264.1 ABC transporter, putative [Trypanosoma brucei gambiense DAL972]